jgi:hypothetical protein
VQFTPDLMPSDITGTEVLEENQSTGEKELPLHPRARVRQHAAGRRDQPHPAQDPGRAAAGHAGEASPCPAPPTRSTSPSSCSPPRTPSSRRAPIRCPRPSSTASCSTSGRLPSAEEEEAAGGAVRSAGGDSRLLQELVRRVPVPDHVMKYAVKLCPRHARRRGAELRRLERFAKQRLLGRRPRASQYLVIGAKARAILRALRRVGGRRAHARAARASPPRTAQLHRRERRPHRRQAGRPHSGARSSLTRGGVGDTLLTTDMRQLPDGTTLARLPRASNNANESRYLSPAA